MDASRAAQQLRRDKETPEARQAHLETMRTAHQFRMQGDMECNQCQNDVHMVLCDVSKILRS